MTKWYSAKEAPNYEEWILTEWYDGDDGGLKYEADYLYSFVYWKDYVRRRGCVISLWRTLFYVIYCIILEVS